MKVVFHLMRWRPVRFRPTHYLVQEPAPLMPGITNPARDTGEPKLQRNPEGVGENDPDIELPVVAKQASRAPDRFFA